MATVTLKLEGFDKLKRAFARAPDAVRRHASTAVYVSSLQVASRARALVPVDSGALQRSIGVSHGNESLSADVGLVSADTYYWRFVEFGTRNMAARPFFRPAAEESASFFVAQMKDVGPQIEHELEEGRLL